MPKDFDAELQAKLDAHDRGFRLGGQDFLLGSDVHPNVLARFDMLQEKGGEKMSARETFETLLDIAPQFLAPQDRERFAALIRDEQAEDEIHEVGVERLQEFIEWAVEEQTGRPFDASSRSGRSAETGTDTTRSTDGSPPPGSNSTPSHSAVSAT